MKKIRYDTRQNCVVVKVKQEELNFWHSNGFVADFFTIPNNEYEDFIEFLEKLTNELKLIRG